MDIRYWRLVTGVALEFEELRILQAAETIADGVWQQVVQWDALARLEH
jgi:hypothetical protein